MELLEAARTSCGSVLNPTDFDEAEFNAALHAGDLRAALDIVDAIADENPAPPIFVESLLAASRLLEAQGETNLEGNIRYYERILEHLRGTEFHKHELRQDSRRS